MTIGTDKRAAAELVDALGDLLHRNEAFAALVAAGPAARAAVRAGLGDGRWEVRRGCAYWLLRFPDDGDLEALRPLLHDPKSRVRQAAVTAVALAYPGNAEVVPLVIERAQNDESLRVRRQAVSLLAWRHAHPDLGGFFAGVAEHESDAKLRGYARAGLRFCRACAAEVAPC